MPGNTAAVFCPPAGPTPTRSTGPLNRRRPKLCLPFAEVAAVSTSPSMVKRTDHSACAVVCASVRKSSPRSEYASRALSHRSPSSVAAAHCASGDSSATGFHTSPSRTRMSPAAMVPGTLASRSRRDNRSLVSSCTGPAFPGAGRALRSTTGMAAVASSTTSAPRRTVAANRATPTRLAVTRQLRRCGETKSAACTTTRGSETSAPSAGPSSAETASAGGPPLLRRRKVSVAVSPTESRALSAENCEHRSSGARRINAMRSKSMVASSPPPLTGSRRSMSTRPEKPSAPPICTR